MCLVSKTDEPFIATEEIKIYKKCRLLGNNELRSHFSWATNNHHYSKIEEAIISPIKIEGPKSRANGWFIIKAGLHGMLKSDDVRSNYFGIFNRFSNEIPILTEWIIPIGAKYYLDEDEKGIVSEKIIFSKVMTNIKEVEINWKK